MSSQNLPTLSIVHPAIKTLKSTLKEVQIRTDEGKEMLANIIQNLDKYFNEFHDYYLLASFLDPRCKIKFMTEDETRRTIATITKLGASLQRGNSDVPSVPRHDKISLLDKMKVISNPTPRTVEAENTTAEITDYLSEPNLTIFGGATVLLYWKNSSFMVLKQLAKKFLSIPASSASVERVFSTLGNIVTKKRASLSSESIEMLGFLSQNAHLIPKNDWIFERGEI